MDDFNNNSAPNPFGGEHNEPTPAPQAQETPAAEPQAQSAAQQTPYQAPVQNKEPQAAQETSPAPQNDFSTQQTPPQSEEPRTPYQTPVQHPAYQTPQSAPFEGFSGGQPQQTPPHHKKSGRKWIVGLCGVAAACLLFAGGAVIGHVAAGGGNSDDGNASVSASADAPTLQIGSKPSGGSSSSSDGMSGQDIYKKVSPSVVSVISTTAEGTGSGSGVIMSKDGYIITNNHVVRGRAVGLRSAERRHLARRDHHRHGRADRPRRYQGSPPPS